MSRPRSDWLADVPSADKVRADAGIGGADQAVFAAIVGNRGAWISPHATVGRKIRAEFRFHRAGKSVYRTVNRVHRTRGRFHRAFQASEPTVEPAECAIAGFHRAVKAFDRTVYPRYRAENSAVSADRVNHGGVFRPSGAVFDNGGTLVGYRRGRIGKAAVPTEFYRTAVESADSMEAAVEKTGAIPRDLQAHRYRRQRMLRAEVGAAKLPTVQIRVGTKNVPTLGCRNSLQSMP